MFKNLKYWLNQINITGIIALIGIVLSYMTVSMMHKTTELQTKPIIVLTCNTILFRTGNNNICPVLFLPNNRMILTDFCKYRIIIEQDQACVTRLSDRYLSCSVVNYGNLPVMYIRIGFNYQLSDTANFKPFDFNFLLKGTNPMKGIKTGTAYFSLPVLRPNESYNFLISNDSSKFWVMTGCPQKIILTTPIKEKPEEYPLSSFCDAWNPNFSTTLQPLPPIPNVSLQECEKLLHKQ